MVELKLEWYLLMDGSNGGSYGDLSDIWVC